MAHNVIQFLISRNSQLKEKMMSYKNILKYSIALLLFLTLINISITNSSAYITDFQTVGMDIYTPSEVPAPDPNDPPEYPEGEEINQEPVDPGEYDPENPYGQWE